jgi:Xaa-Pro aminopeptidase
MNYGARQERVRLSLEAKKIDALLVTNLTNVAYLTGFTGSNGQLVLSAADSVFFTDGRYAARASTMVEGAEIRIYENKLTDLLGDHLAAIDVSRLGIEATTMTVAERDDFSKAIPGVELVSVSKVVEDGRRVKEPEEIDRLREAIRIGDEVFGVIVDRLAPGMTERDVALDIEFELRKRDAEAISFDPIVGSGPLSAHIHHTPSNRALEKGDLVLMDFGCKFGGYCSDMTRTVVLGAATNEQRDLYDLVLRSHLAGIDAISAGAEGVAVDAAARAVIDGAGRAESFGHGLGHGVGLDIHEDPRLSRFSKDVLRAGDVVTVEPGSYTVDWGGIRIEDCVLVTEDGADVMTGAPKQDLIEL